MTISIPRADLFLLRLPLLCILVVSTYVNAEETKKHDATQKMMQLTITPERCVALRQGQTCYQLVEFNWQSITAGDFCLVDTLNDNPLYCWNDATSGQFRLDFQSPQSTNYVMRAKGELIDLAQKTMTVAWVYKSSKRPKASWRLF